MLSSLEPGYIAILFLCLALACAFEFVNGFHDTANAVATVIYTNSLRPVPAVIWSGLMNFLGLLVGVMFWGVGVAMGIVNLLPVEILVDQDINHSLAMVFALLFTAIIWNLGTWWLGLPASSSHTLIGSILGVGVAFSLMPNAAGAAVNWSKAGEIGLSLLISPVFGFSLTVFLMFILKRMVKNDDIFKAPKPGKNPPGWIRAILLLTCTSVSFNHGLNDGQKGVGLVMLILIGVIPAHYALDPSRDAGGMRHSLTEIRTIVTRLDTTDMARDERDSYRAVKANMNDLMRAFSTAKGPNGLPEKERFQVRKDVLVASREIDNLLKNKNVRFSLRERDELKANRDELRRYTDYSPQWVVIMIAICLGLGTMVGWKRIVETVGEKIGKQHLTYAQGASSELVAASTIGLANFFQLPVSTTHVLSSGIAGSMVARRGLKNLQPQTIRNIVMAWLLTLPVTLTMSGTLYLVFRWLF